MASFFSCLFDPSQQGGSEADRRRRGKALRRAADVGRRTQTTLTRLFFFCFFCRFFLQMAAGLEASINWILILSCKHVCFESFPSAVKVCCFPTRHSLLLTDLLRQHQSDQSGWFQLALATCQRLTLAVALAAFSMSAMCQQTERMNHNQFISIV